MPGDDEACFEGRRARLAEKAQAQAEKNENLHYSYLNGKIIPIHDPCSSRFLRRSGKH
jgi:hypothetical protein